ncbi:MAG: Hsp20/alpha crystallin family protein, partial [Bacteroidales bacterium]|nr:Hsp20/alpha crystallin family protein [Bacteroidales bacterium]
FRLEVAAPGLSKEHFRIDLENDTLTLSSNLHQDLGKDEVILRREFCYNVFERSFVLPDSVDTGKIEASHDNGILRIILPKREEAKVKPPREIKIG